MPENSQIEEVVQVIEKLGQIVITLQTRLDRQEETLQSLSKWLTHAFREMGYDFSKIALIESSRRKEEIQNQTNVLMDPEEIDPAVQDEIARKVLKNLPSQDGDICPI